jgi:hypothetical protein
MTRLELPGHYGRALDIDLCAGCHMLWFDGLESVNLTGRGVLNLLRAIDAAHAVSHTPLPARLDCPRCSRELKHVHNQTSLGRTAQHECAHGHGAAQSFSLYLGEKGFLRPLLRPEIERLKAAVEGGFACINCGAPFDPRRSDQCSFCASPVRVLDVLPLMRAVDRQTGQLDEGRFAGSQANPRSFACPGCGGAVDPMLDHACPTCAVPVAVTDLKWALRVMEPLARAVDEEHVTREYREHRIAAVQAPEPSTRYIEKRGERFRMPVGYEVLVALMMAAFFLITWFSR